MVTQKKKKIESMQTNSLQQGFSFLELTIVLALIGLLGAFAVPNFFRTKQGAERKEFLSSLETMLKETVLRATLHHQMHQVFIDIVHEKIEIRVFDKNSLETNQHKQFKQVDDLEYTTEIDFLKRFKIQNFFINGDDEVASGTELQDVMFYIMPDGTSQAIVANFIDQDDDGVAPDVNFSCVINPFYARMSVYDTFQTP